jgi:uncharacterized membrane protein YhaH (DUF805 family)
VDIATSIKSVLGNYANFSGRARRSEYWWWILAVMVTFGVIYGVAATGVSTSADGQASVGAIAWLFYVIGGVLGLALFIPNIAVAIRRLHDVGQSGWMYLLALVPFGGLVLLYFFLKDSQPGANQYGPSPK